ncbi:hypothetical protein F5Y13DRAFT_185896 [Hypoxylon sp. FL1857]|nr:hypothetical protein F5Y13DRAFT_185896 [Hypoxylon sp. FL1857]
MTSLLLLFLAIRVSGRNFLKAVNSPAMFDRTGYSNATKASSQPLWLNSTDPVPTTMLTSYTISTTETSRWPNISYSTGQFPIPSTSGSIPASYSSDEDPNTPTVITLWPEIESPKTLSLPIEASDGISSSAITSPKATFTQSSGSPVYDSSSTTATTELPASTGQGGFDGLPTNGTSSSTQPSPSIVVEGSASTSTITTIVMITVTNVVTITTPSSDYSDQQPATTISPTTTSSDSLLVLPPSGVTSTTSTDSLEVRPLEINTSTTTTDTLVVLPLGEYTSTTATDTVKVRPPS